MKTPIKVSVKAIYNAVCSVSTKAKELLESKKGNRTADASVLFEFKENEFADVKATFNEEGSLRVESSPFVLYEGKADGGAEFVAAEESAACELCDKLAVCGKDEARKRIDDYVESMRS